MATSARWYSRHMKPMTGRSPKRLRPINVGTIGHVDHGASTLALAITPCMMSKADMLKWIEVSMIENLK